MYNVQAAMDLNAISIVHAQVDSVLSHNAQAALTVVCALIGPQIVITIVNAEVVSIVTQI